MSRNLAFCCLAIMVFMTTLVRSAASGGCSVPGLFEAWGGSEAVPVPALDVGRWYRASLGWIVAPGPCQAREVAVEMEAASSAFERHFGRAAPKGAVIDVAHAPHAPALKEAGADWVLPWRFDDGAAPESARAEAIRAQVRAQLVSSGSPVSPERVEVLAQQAIAAVPTSPGLEPKAIRHEIAHLLFIRAVWPSTRRGGEQYGGDAPDWLDEAAAVVAESAEMTLARRQAFRDLAVSGRLIPLERYLGMPHPAFAGGDFQALVEQAREQAGPDGMAVVSTSLPEEQVERARAFYAQTRGFVDYLVHRSGDERVLAEVAEFLRASGSFESWLANREPKQGIPKDLETLERDFRTWARALPEQ